MPEITTALATLPRTASSTWLVSDATAVSNVISSGVPAATSIAIVVGAAGFDLACSRTGFAADGAAAAPELPTGPPAGAAGVVLVVAPVVAPSCPAGAASSDAGGC